MQINDELSLTAQTMSFRHFFKSVPILGSFVISTKRLYRATLARPPAFPGSKSYWEQRYRRGGNSGAGSYGRLSKFKAEIINEWIAKNGITSVIEFGCGDGHQLGLANYPSYLGFDVSETAVKQCAARFQRDSTKRFELVEKYFGEKADLVLSLDVIYHLTEDSAFDLYMSRLFQAAERAVIIYASNSEELNRGDLARHVRHRRFTDWIGQHAAEWALGERIPNRYPQKLDDPENTSFADFYIFLRRKHVDR
jgi:hypothetical protein